MAAIACHLTAVAATTALVYAGDVPSAQFRRRRNLEAVEFKPIVEFKAASDGMYVGSAARSIARTDAARRHGCVEATTDVAVPIALVHSDRTARISTSIDSDSKAIAAVVGLICGAVAMLFRRAASARTKNRSTS